MKFRIKEKMGHFQPQYSYGWLWRRAKFHPLFEVKDDYRFYALSSYCLKIEQAEALLKEIRDFEEKKAALKAQGVKFHAPKL